MDEMRPSRGISRDEYFAAVRLCPTHRAFAGTYEDWIRVTLSDIDKLLAGSQTVQSQKP